MDGDLRHPYKVILLATALVGVHWSSDFSVKAAETGGTPIGQTSTSSGVEPLTLSDDEKNTLVESIVAVHNQLPTPPEYTPQPNAKVPRTLHLSAFSPDLSARIPSLKQYMYAHLDREIVIVDPLKLTTAMVLPLPERLSTNERKSGTDKAALDKVGGLQDLSEPQKHKIYQSLILPGETTGSSPNTGLQAVPPGVALLAGSGIPASIRLTPIPAGVAAEFPRLSGLEFAKLQDGRLIIADPKYRKVVGLITEDEGRRKAESKPQGSRDPLRNLEEGPNASAYTGPRSKR